MGEAANNQIVTGQCGKRCDSVVCKCGPSVRVGKGQPPAGGAVLSSKEHQVLPRKTGRGKEIAFQSQETTQEKGDNQGAWEYIDTDI